MKKHIVLLLGRQLPVLEAKLASKYDLRLLSEQVDPKSWIEIHGHEVETLVTSPRFVVDRALIDALPNLGAISTFSVGYDPIDIARACERKIAIGYTPDLQNDCVADAAFCLLIDVAHRFSEADRFVRCGRRRERQFPPGASIARKRIGILGMGRIGRVIARRASGFEMTVRYHNRREVSGREFAYMPTANGLAAWVDFLVVAASGGDQTRHQVSSQVLEALGPRFLINIARGLVIDQSALVDFLRDRRIAGAGLDV